MILTFLQQLLSAVPMVIALLFVLAANMPRSRRVQQYPMPIIAAIYAVGALVVLYLLNTWIEDVLRAFFQVLPMVYDTRWQYTIENTAAVLIFVLLKLLLRSLFSRAFEGQNFLGSTLVDGLYRYDADYGMWFVHRRNAMLRVYLRVFYWSSIVLAVVLTALAGTFPAAPAFAAVAFPALAALVVGEIYFAVDGVTEEEFRHDVLGERDRAERVVDYAALREVLKDTFAGRVIDDGLDFSSSDAVRTFDRLDALSRSASDVDQLAAAYFSRLKASGTTLDSNLIDAAADIMRGRSTLVNNPFYGDLTPYLVFPAYYHLLHYRKCLIVCGRDEIAADLVRWIEGGLESITGVPDLWRVELLDQQPRADLDIGVLRFADIHNLELFRANDEFLGDVHYVILGEPSRILATGQLGLGLLQSRLGGRESPVFAAFDRNHDGLVDALAHQLKVDLTDVVAAAVPRGVTTRVVWRADGPDMHAAVLPTISRYLGMGTEIGAVALKYQISEVEWIGSGAFPVHDMAWIAGQYYAQVNAFADLDLSQHALSDAIRARSNPWDLAPADNRFLIVEDEICNVYESIRLYATRAEKQGFVNLISEDYLLRDYMVANASIFAADPKAVPSFAADRARTERNLILRLILMLLTFGVSEPALAREFALIGQPLPPVIPPAPDRLDDEEISPAHATLRRLIARHTGVADAVITCELAPGESVDGDDEPLERFFRLEDGGPLDPIVESLRAAYFFVEDEVEDRNYIGSALYGLVHQMYLPGQFVTYAGRYYEVQSVGDEQQNGGVVLRRAAEHIRARRVYRLLRNFRVGDIRRVERTGAEIIVDDISFTRCYATIEVDTVGYLELPSRSDLAGARRSEVAGIPSRRYANKELLRVRMPGVPASVRRTLAVLLNELFVTIFPHAHRYVTALTSDDGDAFGDLLPGLEVMDDEGDDDAIYIVEDSLIDLGLLVAVHRNWRRLLEIITDYLVWHETPTPAPAAGTNSEAVPVFPDDSPEDVERRALIIAQQDVAPSPEVRPPPRMPWWRRVWRRLTAILPSSRRAYGVGAEPSHRVEPPRSTPVPPDMVTTGVSIDYSQVAGEVAAETPPGVPDIVIDDTEVEFDGAGGPVVVGSDGDDASEQERADEQT